MSTRRTVCASPSGCHVMSVIQSRSTSTTPARRPFQNAVVAACVCRVAHRRSTWSRWTVGWRCIPAIYVTSLMDVHGLLKSWFIIQRIYRRLTIFQRLLREASRSRRSRSRKAAKRGARGSVTRELSGGSEPGAYVEAACTSPDFGAYVDSACASLCT